MGRHSSDAQFRFYRSVIGWFLPWALVAAVAATALWIAVDALLPNELDAQPPAGAVATSSPSPTPARKESPSPTPSPTPLPTKTRGGTGDGKKDDEKSGGKESKKNKGGNDEHQGENQPGGGRPDEPAPLITDGITVQVLNGTADATADDLMANRLARLGFDVIAIDVSTSYAETTVLWSYAEAEPAAQALGARFGWHVAPKPDNLSSQVAIHVVVGDDET